MIRTKKHPIKFYLTASFVFLSCCVVGSLLIYKFIELQSRGALRPVMYMLPMYGGALLLLGLYLLKLYIKNAPTICLDKQSIAFGGEQFRLSEIKSISLSGKIPFGKLLKFRLEGAALEFTHGRVKYIYDDMYANSWQLKSLLEKALTEKQENRALRDMKVEPRNISSELVEEFGGTQLTSYRGISFWGISLFLFVLILFMAPRELSVWIFYFLFFPVWFLVNSLAMHFFWLTRDSLLVKNRNMPWRQHRYLLADIREVVFERQGRSPNTLRIIQADHKSKKYPAGTLRDKTWLELKKRLEDKGVRVRNECI